MNKKTIISIAVVFVVIVLVFFFARSVRNNQAASVFELAPSFMSSKFSATTTAAKLPVVNRLLCLVKQTGPRVRVISPNGGEVYRTGQQILVKWETCNWNALNTVHISIYSAVYDQYQEITVTNNDGQEPIPLPDLFHYMGANPIIPGNHYKIRIALGGNPSLADSSDNFFSLFTLPGGVGTATSTTATTSSATSSTSTATSSYQGPVNGVCGYAHGKPATASPTWGWCESGQTSLITGHSPWIWGCFGHGGGVNVACSTTYPTNSGTSTTSTSTSATSTSSTGSAATTTTATTTSGTSSASGSRMAPLKKTTR